jgi:hypothetical protein
MLEDPGPSCVRGGKRIDLWGAGVGHPLPHRHAAVTACVDRVVAVKGWENVVRAGVVAAAGEAVPVVAHPPLAFAGRAEATAVFAAAVRTQFLALKQPIRRFEDLHVNAGQVLRLSILPPN